MLASMRVLRCVILFTFVLVACAPEKLTGTDLGAQSAPDFALVDGMTGANVSLGGLRGNVVALAFLYTRCPDICPLTAEYFRQSQSTLGSDSSRVQFVAVSVDPINDVPQSVRAFSEQHQLARNWHFLIGPAASLQSVWSAYGIRQEPDASTGSVGHTDAIYLIDASGKARVLLHTADGPDALTKDLRILAKER
jgi:protein SCO1/2